MSKGYFDIHTHILPQIDDGAGSMEEAIRMLEKQYEQGVHHVIATPHFVPGRSEKRVERINLAFEEVEEEIKRRQMDLKLYKGNELYFREGVLEALEKGGAFTLADTAYILVEFNIHKEYKQIKKGMKEALAHGYRPILAHAERYECIQKEPGLLKDLVDNGIYIQMNTESFMGGLFNRSKKTWLGALNEGLVHFLGSDCHSATGRAPLMEDAISKIRKKADERILEKILYENPAKLLQDKYI